MWGPRFDEVIGDHIRTFRQTFDLTGDSLAAAARSLSLKWHRPTVSQIETGARGLTAPELLLLPEIFNRAHITLYGEPIEPEIRPNVLSFLTGSPVGVTPTVFARRQWIEANITGDWELIGGLAGLESFHDSLATYRHIDREERTRRAEALVPKRLRGFVPAAMAIEAGDVERNVAASLNVETIQVAVAALHLWGHSVAEERERRLAEQGGARGRGAKSHMTRKLAKEIGDIVATFPKGDK